MKTEREQKIFEQLITLFEQNGGKNNPIFANLCEALYRIDKMGRLAFDFADKKPSEHGCIRGHFSAYYNEMAVVLYSTDYESKWGGFFTDWNRLSINSVQNIMNTFLHEIVHYVAFNNSAGYLRLWNSKQKELLKTAFVRLILNYGELFLPDVLRNKKNLNATEVFSDKKFNKTFETYYSVIRQTDMVKISMMYSIYSKLSQILYYNCDWAWARFFDNVFTTIVTVMCENGIVDKETSAIYTSLRKSYISMFPGIERAPEFCSLFYQEMFVPSEIACIELPCADTIQSLQPLAIKTLQLV